MANEPIDPQPYVAGVTVVDIGDIRVARGKTRRPRSTCKHKNMAYDTNERRVYCHDCEQEVDPFDAFLLLTESWDASIKRLQSRAREIEEAEKFTLRRRAAKTMDEAWRRKDTVPGCPHCHEALLPEDVAGKRLPLVSRRIAEAKRKKQKEISNSQPKA